MKHVNISVRGKVQGVWYRESARRKAISLGLFGFVCNRPDGSVYAEVEGNETAISLFVDWCKTGPELARVESVEFVEAPSKSFSQFDVRR